MIRGYAVVVDSDSPLPDIPALHRKASITLATVTTKCGFDEKTEFKIVYSYDNKNYSFKVAQNIRLVDKCSIDSGLVRIGFSEPEQDIVVSCNPADLKKFVATLEVVQHLTPTCVVARNLSCLCDVRSEIKTKLCEECSWHVVCTLPSHAAVGRISACPQTCLQTIRISVTALPFLREICVANNNLVDLPESLGLLPCLRVLYLSHNLLGLATNWDFLSSPIIRENLKELYLTNNGMTSVPDAITRLRNLHKLVLSQNSLTALPATMAKLKNLRSLYVADNRLTVLPTWMYHKECFNELHLDGNYFYKSTLNNWTRPKCGDFEILTVPTLFATVANCIVSERGLYIADNSLTVLPMWMYHKQSFNELYLNGNDFYRSTHNNWTRPKPEDFEIFTVPTLFGTVANFIVSERLPFWEYNIPDKLTDYLEEAYYCRCGSVVLPDIVGGVVLRCYIATGQLARIYCGYKNTPIAIRCCSYKCYKLMERYIR